MPVVRVVAELWQTRTNFIPFFFLLEIDEFHGFPAFPLLFWHERFLLCRISCLQVDLEKRNN